jgi:hypothetical protein
VRANLDWLAGEKKAHYIAVVKEDSFGQLAAWVAPPGRMFRA